MKRYLVFTCFLSIRQIVLKFVPEYGYKMATKVLKLQRKSMILVNKITENPEKILSATQGSLNLIREGGRTVGSGRVATIIE